MNKLVALAIIGFYLIIGIVTGFAVMRYMIIHEIKDWNDYIQQEEIVVWGVVVGLFWPIALPICGIILAGRKFVEQVLNEKEKN